jgi:hypothetical protein
MTDAKNALAALRAKKAPSPDPTTCPECKGKCCRDHLGYRLTHMGDEFYEHVCEACEDGTKYVAPLGLYLLTQNTNRNYDTFDSCVVAAESVEDAKRVHPYGEEYEYRESAGEWGRWGHSGYWLDDRTWAKPENVTATRIGVADPSIKAGTVVLASFTAG